VASSDDQVAISTVGKATGLFLARTSNLVSNRKSNTIQLLKWVARMEGFTDRNLVVKRLCIIVTSVNHSMKMLVVVSKWCKVVHLTTPQR
jgi:hypothetical protein